MKEVDPQSTSRALAFELWMQAPMPMVTLMKTLDVTALVRLSRKRGYKFNMLLCWCIGKAAASMEDFYLLPVGDKLMQYDRLAVNTVVAVRDGGIATCDIPVSADLEQFDQYYRKLTEQVRESGDHCPCQGKCPHHGNCFECVTLHRGHRDHLPMCMWDMLNERIAALSHMTEGTLYEYEKKQAACTDCEGCPGCGE